MFGRRPRPAEGEADRAAGRRFGAAPLILSLLLLLGAAGGFLWLHLTGELEPLLAGGPRIEAAIPLAASTDAPVEVAVAEVPVAEVPLAEIPIEDLPAEDSVGETRAEAEVAPAEAAAPAPPAPNAPEEGAPEESAPDESAMAELSPAEAPPPGSDAAPAAVEEPTATESVTPESAPPPPAPPAPEIEPEIEPEPDAAVSAPPVPADDAAAEPPPRGESLATAPERTETAAAENDQPENDPAEDSADATAADSPQVAAATVPPGTVPSWQRFARPFPADENRPRIAVVVAGLGLSEAATTAAIQQLPGEITLSFSPYSNRIEEWVAMARAAGHEVMIDLPMEPTSFPRDDPGPQALLTSLSDGTNAERLEWVLERADGYVGVASYMGSRFTTSPAHLRPVLEALSRRGLLFLDSRAAADSEAAKLAGEIGLPHAINDRFLDNEASRVAIDGRLQQIERIARTRGVAVAIGYAYPVTIERLVEWSRGLTGKGLALAPISAVTDRQEDR